MSESEAFPDVEVLTMEAIARGLLDGTFRAPAAAVAALRRSQAASLTPEEAAAVQGAVQGVLERHWAWRERRRRQGVAAPQ